MTPFDFELLTTIFEEAAGEVPFDVGILGMCLYEHLRDHWDNIPAPTRAVMMTVGADLRKEYYRRVQEEFDAKLITERLRHQR